MTIKISKDSKLYNEVIKLIDFKKEFKNAVKSNKLDEFSKKYKDILSKPI
jgi:hypothetical protein